MTDAAEHYMLMEANARRPDMPHPDTCAKIRAKGAQWAIPHRHMRVLPIFGRNGVSVTCSSDQWPQAKELLAAAPVHSQTLCSRCQRPVSAVLDIGRDDMHFVSGAFDLAAKLLRKHYVLTDAQLADLLAFERKSPSWISDLLRWCGGVDSQDGMTRGVPAAIAADAGCKSFLKRIFVIIGRLADLLHEGIRLLCGGGKNR